MSRSASSIRTVALGAGIALAVAGCSGGRTETVRADGARVTADVREGAIEAPGVSIGGGVAAVTVEAPPAPDPLQAMFGPWTLARSGDRVCTIDLGSRNAVGDYTAKTRRCASIELARIALWSPTGDGLVLYDFERRPVIVFRRGGDDLYEGQLLGQAVTLWR